MGWGSSPVVAGMGHKSILPQFLPGPIWRQIRQGVPCRSGTRLTRLNAESGGSPPPTSPLQPAAQLEPNYPRFRHALCSVRTGGTAKAQGCLTLPRPWLGGQRPAALSSGQTGAWPLGRNLAALCCPLLPLAVPSLPLAIPNCPSLSLAVPGAGSGTTEDAMPASALGAWRMSVQTL